MNYFYYIFVNSKKSVCLKSVDEDIKMILIQIYHYLFIIKNVGEKQNQIETRTK